MNNLDDPEYLEYLEELENNNKNNIIMKKYSKLIIAAIIALIFIGTFVFLWQKSQPKETVYNEFTPKQDRGQRQAFQGSEAR